MLIFPICDSFLFGCFAPYDTVLKCRSDLQCSYLLNICLRVALLALLISSCVLPLLCFSMYLQSFLGLMISSLVHLHHSALPRIVPGNKDKMFKYCLYLTVVIKENDIRSEAMAVGGISGGSLQSPRFLSLPLRFKVCVCFSLHPNYTLLSNTSSRI